METRHKIEGKIRVYKNINREAMVFGLPSNVFWVFLAVAVPLAFLSIILPHILKALVLILGCGLYGAMWALVEKFGVHFFKKLIAHYGESFSIVRKNRLTHRILRTPLKANTP
jgi:hypothetical protein